MKYRIQELMSPDGKRPLYRIQYKSWLWGWVEYLCGAIPLYRYSTLRAAEDKLSQIITDTAPEIWKTKEVEK